MLVLDNITHFTTWDSVLPLGIGLNCLQLILRNMGPPYSEPRDISHRKSRLSTNLNIFRNTIAFLVTFKRLIGLDARSLGEAGIKMAHLTSNISVINAWPRDDVEAKLVAIAVATYTYFCSQKSGPLLWDDSDKVPSFSSCATCCSSRGWPRKVPVCRPTKYVLSRT